MEIWHTNTLSLVSFLWMKPYLFLILNHFTDPKLSLQGSSCSLLWAATSLPLLMVPCWVSVLLLMAEVTVMMTGASCGNSTFSQGCRWHCGCSGLSGLCSPLQMESCNAFHSFTPGAGGVAHVVEHLPSKCETLC
jgi:hypothetical protein